MAVTSSVMSLNSVNRIRYLFHQYYTSQLTDQLKYSMNDIFKPTIDWIRTDYAEHPTRFALELLAWFMSISCTIWMGYTLPTPPFIYLYPLFIVQCSIFAWAAWTRGSTGMIANYLLISTIDIVAYIRMISA